MTEEQVLAVYKAVPVDDLIRIRAMISRGDKFVDIAERAGLPVAVIKITAARSRRAAARAARKAERAATPVA